MNDTAYEIRNCYISNGEEIVAERLYGYFDYTELEEFIQRFIRSILAPGWRSYLSIVDHDGRERNFVKYAADGGSPQ
jgi:hypothetical protein